MPALSVAIHGPLVCTCAQDNGEEIRCLQTGVTKKHCVWSTLSSQYARKAAAQFLPLSSYPSLNQQVTAHAKTMTRFIRDYIMLEDTMPRCLSLKHSLACDFRKFQDI